ncbi:molybdopterin-dependent oxidoreductase [Chloroflexota bacterium]
MGATEIKKAMCKFCHSQCRVLVYSEDGRLTKIEEDRSSPKVDAVQPPISACIRLRGAKEFMYHPDRVNFPLKRAGEKGEGKWHQISWDQALDEIADKLKAIIAEHGPQSIGSITGTGRTMGEYPTRFFHLLGTPNKVGSTQICFGPRTAVGTAMFGWAPSRKLARPINSGSGTQPVTKCALLIGLDPAQGTPPLWKGILNGTKIGTKLIVVDPRRTDTAAIADLWLQPRPGTDTALLLSMINVVIQEELYDKDFVEKWCYGFDKLAERAQDYPPEKASEITWVPAEQIRAAARMYATSKPATAIHGMGLEQQQGVVEALQAEFSLMAITGNLDVEGGNELPGPSRAVPVSDVTLERTLSSEQKELQLGADRFKLISWPGRNLMNDCVKKVWGSECGTALVVSCAHAPTFYRAIITGEPYAPKAVINHNSNPLVTQSNAKLVYKALKRLELYVVLDLWMTPSAEIADYVLPVASWLERPWFGDIAATDCNLEAGETALPASIPGEYDHKTDYEIFRELGIRLGQEEYWPWHNYEEGIDYRLEPLGMSFEEFMAKGGFDFHRPGYKKYERTGFATPTGKVELYSTIFEKLGYDPLPKFEEPHETPISTPELAREYPLMLITGGRFHTAFHSELRNIDSLRNRHPHPLVQINPKTATKNDISDGDWVWIESPRGTIRMKCQYFEGIDPGVIHCEHGWWFPELPGEEPWLHGVWESNVNVLTQDDPEHCNNISGGWPLKTALCKIYKVKNY